MTTFPLSTKSPFISLRRYYSSFFVLCKYQIAQICPFRRITFSHCYQLKEVTFPNTVTAVGKWAFSHCNTIETVTIPESVFSIDQYAFYSCNALKSIIIPASITFIGNDALSNCPDMSTIYVNDKSFAHQWCLDNGYENVIQIH